ncbi:ribosomal MRP49 [Fusarium subglutinans]|uniref:Ribosomal MRP49 n=1 Tax=Gibberella subglutinans TaxID=42677 RepID=A0A8H5V1L7_GIBSU|nr:ribosomal MRP49 [Fusarium subglutinans]KAF5607216.1 ribosomal MRP49 [Fusarium subglutinans]
MRSLGERFNKLRAIISLRCGPGAAILPPEVTRIHMDFATSFKNGHMGAKKFWRENLPRLKYHNPSVPMIVNRHSRNNKKPTISIYLRKPDASTPAPATRSQPSSSRNNMSKATPPDADEKIITVDMTEKHSSHILEYVLAETRAVPIKPTKEEIRELQELDAMARQAEVDRARMRSLREEKKREEDMLKRARAAGGVSEEEDS